MRSFFTLLFLISFSYASAHALTLSEVCQRRTAWGLSYLHHMISLNAKSQMYQFLLRAKNKVDLTDKDFLGDTVLHGAVWHGNKECFFMLFVLGADVTTENLDGLTPCAYTSSLTVNDEPAIKYVLECYQNFLQQERSLDALPSEKRRGKEVYVNWFTRYVIYLREGLDTNRKDYDLAHLALNRSRFVYMLKLLKSTYVQADIDTLLDAFSSHCCTPNGVDDKKIILLQELTALMEITDDQCYMDYLKEEPLFKDFLTH